MAGIFLTLRRHFTNSSSKHVDIIISGGGMIGTTLAACLGRNPILSARKILLLEASPMKKWQFKPTYSNRVSSINQNTVNLMKSIGAWNHMVETRVKAVSGMKNALFEFDIKLYELCRQTNSIHFGLGAEARNLGANVFLGKEQLEEVWDCSDAVVHFDQISTDDPVSYIVENDVLIAAVEKELENIENVTVLHQSKVKNYTFPTEFNKPVHLTLDDGSQYSCDLLLGADGANSQVRKAMGGQYLGWAYDQFGIVATLHLEKGSKNDVAWQKFLPTGPVAFLPLTDELSSLVWSTTKENAKTLLQLSNDQFVDALNSALYAIPTRPQLVDLTKKCINEVLNKFSINRENSAPLPPQVISVQDGSRAAFPLGFGHSVSYVAQSVALVGDAAHKIHPLAGQGVNLGFGDIACLVDQLTKSMQNGFPLGHTHSLLNYEQERQKHNIPTMVAVDLMARVYTSSNPTLMALGSVALQVANTVTPIKEMMIKQGST